MQIIHISGGFVLHFCLEDLLRSVCKLLLHKLRALVVRVGHDRCELVGEGREGDLGLVSLNVVRVHV